MLLSARVVAEDTTRVAAVRHLELQEMGNRIALSDHEIASARDSLPGAVGHAPTTRARRWALLAADWTASCSNADRSVAALTAATSLCNQSTAQRWVLCVTTERAFVRG